MFIPITDFNGNLVFVPVSVEILTHSEFQPDEKFLAYLLLLTKSTITLSEINFITYNLHHALNTWFHLI